MEYNLNQRVYLMIEEENDGRTERHIADDCNICDVSITRVWCNDYQMYLEKSEFGRLWFVDKIEAERVLNASRN